MIPRHHYHRHRYPIDVISQLSKSTQDGIKVRSRWQNLLFEMVGK